MPKVLDPNERGGWLFNQQSNWGEYLDSLNVNLTEGDVIYIANDQVGIFAWGYLLEKRLNGRIFINIGRGAIRPTLIDKAQIHQEREISELLRFSGGKFTFLTNKQVKIINSLLPYEVSKPPMPRKKQFIVNQSIEENEDLCTEFKLIKNNKIPDVAYEYAQAFLNQDGGRLYVGIQDKDKIVVGNNIEYSKLDEIGQKVENKLLTINPPIYPREHYSITFHEIIDGNGSEIKDYYIFELEIKPNEFNNYRSAGGKLLVKTFSGKRRKE